MYKCFTTKDRVSISLIYFLSCLSLLQYSISSVSYAGKKEGEKIAILFSLNCLFATSNPDNDHVIVVVISLV